MNVRLPGGGRSRLLRLSFLATLIGVGFWLRTLLPLQGGDGLSAYWPWKTATVTLYFTDGPFLFPVSRRVPLTAETPLLVLNALLTGPAADMELRNPIPAGVEIRSFRVSDGTAHIDLSSAFSAKGVDRRNAEMIILETMTALPGITSIVLSVEGKALIHPQKRVPLLYYASSKGLVAAPVPAGSPREALASYLSGPPDPDLTGLPRDVRLLGYDYDPAEGLLSLNFTYTPSLRELALDRPAHLRLAMLGLITSLTEFPEVRFVRLDFEGQTRLGLGQCSDLLRTRQPRPALLNDERLIGH
jgi:spore germination protein GerM